MRLSVCLFTVNRFISYFVDRLTVNRFDDIIFVNKRYGDEE